MRRKESLNILLNGPSFSYDKVENLDAINLVTNQFSTHEAYTLIKPDIYLFCDSFYWDESVSDFYKSRRSAAIDDINKKTNWEMEIWAPNFIKDREQFINKFHNEKIKLNFFNARFSILLSYGILRRLGKLVEFLWDKRIIAPPPHNVVLYCLYVAKLLRIKEISLYGADQDYFKGFAVNENNELTKVTNYHNETLFRKIYTDKQDLKISNIADELIKQGELFKLISRYGKMLTRSGYKVKNMNKDSMIDCFPKN